MLDSDNRQKLIVDNNHMLSCPHCEIADTTHDGSTFAVYEPPSVDATGVHDVG